VTALHGTGGKPAIQLVRDVAAQAAAVIDDRFLRVLGRVPSRPESNRRHGRDSVISGKPIVNLPGSLPTLTTAATVFGIRPMGNCPRWTSSAARGLPYERVSHEIARGARTLTPACAAFGDEGTAKGVSL